jgi:hypothetical protein
LVGHAVLGSIHVINFFVKIIQHRVFADKWLGIIGYRCQFFVEQRGRSFPNEACDEWQTLHGFLRARTVVCGNLDQFHSLPIVQGKRLQHQLARRKDNPSKTIVQNIFIVFVINSKGYLGQGVVGLESEMQQQVGEWREMFNFENSPLTAQPEQRLLNQQRLPSIRINTPQL